MAEQRIPIRHVAAVVVGNALAFYDFLSYAYFAVQIGNAFFPDKSSALLLSFATFGAGFLTRPIGGIVIGTLADRIGRKPAMMLSFILMGIAIVGVALTPPYKMIGVAAPISVLFFRLLLGFALGGEVGPTTAYLLEASPPNRRGFFTSLQFATQDFSSFLAGLVGFTLASMLSNQALDDWGWRVAFLIGASIVPVGVMIRSTLPETLESHEAEKTVKLSAIIPHLRIAIIGFVLLAAGTMISYAQTDLTAYASANLNMPTQIAFLATVVSGLTTAVFDVIGGALSDRFGRKPVIICGTLAMLVVTIPGFLAITHFRNAEALLGTAALLGAANGIAAPPILTAITEALPARIRAGALSIVYALAISIFGGTTPFMITWLIKVTNDPMIPGWYMAGASAVTLIAILLARETAPKRAPAPANS